MIRERMIRERIAKVGEEILQEELRMISEEMERYVSEEMERYELIEETEEEILWSFEYMEGEIDNIIADGYDPIVEAELIREEIIDTLEEISYVLYDRDLTVEDLLEDVRDKISDARQRGKNAEFEIEFWNEEYGIIVYRLYRPMYRSSYNILWF